MAEAAVTENGVTSHVEADGTSEQVALDPEEAAAAQQFQEECARELKARLDQLNTGFKHNVEARFNDLESRYGEHKEINKSLQTDLLRVNKITRDVSRALGDEWQGVFRMLMAGLDEDVVKSELAMIEKSKSYMRAYKALMRWREVKGEEGVNIEALIDALNACGKSTLADHVKAVLYSAHSSTHLETSRNMPYLQNIHVTRSLQAKGKS